MQAYWDFGVGNVIQQMNNDPDFVANKRVSVTADGSYFANYEAARIDELSGGRFKQEGNGYFNIGGDFGKMFDGCSME